MAYTTPINNYTPTTKILNTLHNQISDNIIYLKDTSDTQTTDIAVNTESISTNVSNISTNTENISTNASNISTINEKVGQSLNPTDNVTFNSVSTDNVSVRQKLFTGTLNALGKATIISGITPSKVLSISSMALDNLTDLGWRDIVSVIGGQTYIFNSIRLNGNIEIDGAGFYGNENYRCLITYQA